MGVVSFTGSTDVGRKVSEACAPAFKHCHLEMGGKNVIMVMDDARLDLAERYERLAQASQEATDRTAAELAQLRASVAAIEQLLRSVE